MKRATAALQPAKSELEEAGEEHRERDTKGVRPHSESLITRGRVLCQGGSKGGTGDWACNVYGMHPSVDDGVVETAGVRRKGSCRARVVQ